MRSLRKRVHELLAQGMGGSGKFKDHEMPCVHTDTQTHRHTDTQTHRHTDTQTHTQPYMHAVLNASLPSTYRRTCCMGHRFRGNMYLFLGHLALKSEASDDDRCAKHSRSLMAWMTFTPKLRIIILTIIYFPCSTSPCSFLTPDDSPRRVQIGPTPPHTPPRDV